MDKNKHIEESNEFEKLRTLLKDLPKVGAPDNFEYNLMTRIHNKNFQIKSEKKRNIFFWVYTPAFALAASAILIFFVITDNSVDNDNPWNSKPKLIPELQTSETSSVSSSQQNNNQRLDVKEKISNSVAAKEENSVKAKSSLRKLEKPSIQQNNVASNSKTKPVYPFDKSKSVDLDKLLTAEEQTVVPNNGISQPQLASEGNTNTLESPFSGFFIRQKEAAARRESLKVREDSLRRIKESQSKKKNLEK